MVVTSQSPITVTIPDSPAETQMLAVLHTHPYCEGYLPNRFSPGDMDVSAYYDVPIFLYGADGTYAKYDAATNLTTYYFWSELLQDPHYPK